MKLFLFEINITKKPLSIQKKAIINNISLLAPINY